MEKIKERVTHYGLYVTAMLKWLAVGALVGGVGGVVGAAVHLGVGYATQRRTGHPWVLDLLPFGTPLTATIFALEVISVGVLYYAGLLPCFTASLTGYYIALVMGVEPTRFTVAMPALEWGTLGLTALLAVGCAVWSSLFVGWMDWREMADAGKKKLGLRRAVVLRGRHLRLRVRRAAGSAAGLCRGGGTGGGVLRRCELPHRVGDPQRGAVRRGRDGLFCGGLRHQLSAVRLLRAVQQPDHSVFQAEG